MFGQLDNSAAIYLGDRASHSVRPNYLAESNYLYYFVKLVPSHEADDVAVTSSQSVMPCRDR